MLGGEEQEGWFVCFRLAQPGLMGVRRTCCSRLRCFTATERAKQEEASGETDNEGATSALSRELPAATGGILQSVLRASAFLLATRKRSGAVVCLLRASPCVRLSQSSRCRGLLFSFAPLVLTPLPHQLQRSDSHAIVCPLVRGLFCQLALREPSKRDRS